MIYNSVSPKYYGLPKVHKPNLSLRPIISSINAPNSNIAQLITDILTKSYDPNNEYFIKDSFEFASFIQEKQLPLNFVIVSLDVVSLFDNIPLQLIKDSIDKHWLAIQNNCTLSKESFFNALDFIFQTTYFAYDNNYYKKILGTPMGSTVSPIVAQYVMDDLLDTVIPNLPFNFTFIKKYVDDIICAIPANFTDDILQFFNAYNPHIQFTIELERDRKIPFLDTLLIRRDDKTVILDWHIKPTSSGRFMNFQSFHPYRMKINLILGMKNRVTKISHNTLLNKNLKMLRTILTENSYPLKLLNKLLFNTVTNSTPVIPPGDNVDTSMNRFIFGSIPFLGELSDKIINVLKQNPNIKIAQRIAKPISNLYSKLKQKDTKLLTSDVVYSLPCNNCNQHYFGQTTQLLKSRLAIHKSDSRLERRRCALSEHVIDKGHHINFDQVKILHIEHNNTKRLFLEMIEISNSSSAMNKKTDIENLSQIYSYILTLNKPPNILEDNLGNTVNFQELA
jgi:Reverse transcriptase (RNA-dependent DNA polymerase)